MGSTTCQKDSVAQNSKSKELRRLDDSKSPVNVSVVPYECTWTPDDVVVAGLKVDIGGDPFSRPILPCIRTFSCLS